MTCRKGIVNHRRQHTRYGITTPFVGTPHDKHTNQQQLFPLQNLYVHQSTKVCAR